MLIDNLSALVTTIFNSLLNGSVTLATYLIPPAGVLFFLFPEKVEKFYSRDPQITWRSGFGFDFTKKSHRIKFIRLVGFFFAIFGGIFLLGQIAS